jgi:RNA polymerase sigma-70 factor (ECF subfamily)
MSPDSQSSSHAIQLARQAADGDESAFAQLFDRFRDHLKRFIDLRMDDRIRARVDPSDVLQETQIEVHRRLQDYLERNPMPLRIWLRQTARERLIAARDAHLGAAKRSVVREQPMTRKSSIMLAQRFSRDTASPSQQVDRRERQQLVARAISLLRPQDQEILLMRNVEALDFNEIAASLEIPAATARQRYGRALIRLRQQIVQLEN